MKKHAKLRTAWEGAMPAGAAGLFSTPRERNAGATDPLAKSDGGVFLSPLGLSEARRAAKIG